MYSTILSIPDIVDGTILMKIRNEITVAILLVDASQEPGVRIMESLMVDKRAA